MVIGGVDGPTEERRLWWSESDVSIDVSDP